MRKVIYEGGTDNREDVVVEDRDVVAFREDRDDHYKSLRFLRDDAIGAAKAILAHFDVVPDAALGAEIARLDGVIDEKDAEITRIEGILHARTDTVLRLQKEVSMVSTDLGEARDTIARMRESDSEKPELRREIARLKGAVGEKDAEIARLCSALDDAESRDTAATEMIREARDERDDARRRASEAEKGVEALDELTRCYRMVIADAIVRGGLERR